MRDGDGVWFLVRRLSVIKRPYTGRDSLAELTGTINYELITKSYIHVGSGRAVLGVSKELVNTTSKAITLEEALRNIKSLRSSVSTTCLELVRYGDKVCIPGSSIKGIVRSRLELLSSPTNNEVESCFRVVASPPMLNPPPSGSQGWRHARIWWDAPSQDRVSSCDPLSTGDYSLCVICNIFGAPGVASRVFFGNACTEGKVRILTEVLDHGECLELIPPNTMFLGEFSFTNLKPEELGLVLIGMGAKSDGSFTEILLGKSKYRLRETPSGTKVELGRAVFRLRRIELRDYSISKYSLDSGLTRLLSKCLKSEYSLRCEDDALNDLIKELVRRTLNTFKTFSKAESFSEVRRKLELGS